jgi:hypothetical protein
VCFANGGLQTRRTHRPQAYVPARLDYEINPKYQKRNGLKRTMPGFVIV